MPMQQMNYYFSQLYDFWRLIFLKSNGSAGWEEQKYFLSTEFCFYA